MRTFEITLRVSLPDHNEETASNVAGRARQALRIAEKVCKSWEKADFVDVVSATEVTERLQQEIDNRSRRGPAAGGRK